MNNHALIQKAKVGLGELVAGNGQLETAHAREFLRIAITEANLMPMCTVVPMRAQQQRLNTVGLSQRILRAGTPGVPVAIGAGQTGLDFTAPEFDAKLFRGEIPVEEEVLEDAIEQGRFKDTILNLIPQAVGRDMDEIAINGDTASADPFLAQFDGFLKKVTSNVHDFAGAKFADPVLADPFGDLTAMMRLVPRHHRRDRDRMNYLSSFLAEDDYRNAVIARSTASGDSALTSDGKIRFKGRPIHSIGMWPENLGGGNDTQALLCNTKNLQFGIWRDVRIKIEEEPREGMIYFIVSLRFDVQIADETACVKGINILN